MAGSTDGHAKAQDKPYVNRVLSLDSAGINACFEAMILDGLREKVPGFLNETRFFTGIGCGGINALLMAQAMAGAGDRAPEERVAEGIRACREFWRSDELWSALSVPKDPSLYNANPNAADVVGPLRAVLEKYLKPWTLGTLLSDGVFAVVVAYVPNSRRGGALEPRVYTNVPNGGQAPNPDLDRSLVEVAESALSAPLVQILDQWAVAAGLSPTNPTVLALAEAGKLARLPAETREKVLGAGAGTIETRVLSIGGGKMDVAPWNDNGIAAAWGPGTGVSGGSGPGTPFPFGGGFPFGAGPFASGDGQFPGSWNPFSAATSAFGGSPAAGSPFGPSAAGAPHPGADAAGASPFAGGAPYGWDSPFGGSPFGGSPLGGSPFGGSQAAGGTPFGAGDPLAAMANPLNILGTLQSLLSGLFSSVAGAWPGAAPQGASPFASWGGSNPFEAWTAAAAAPFTSPFEPPGAAPHAGGTAAGGPAGGPSGEAASGPFGGPAGQPGCGEYGGHSGACEGHPFAFGMDRELNTAAYQYLSLLSKWAQCFPTPVNSATLLTEREASGFLGDSYFRLDPAALEIAPFFATRAVAMNPRFIPTLLEGLSRDADKQATRDAIDALSERLTAY